VDPKREACWIAQHRTEKGTSFDIEGVSSAECPVSLVTPESMEYLMLWIKCKRLHEGIGGTPLGPNLGDTPAATVDAMNLLEVENSRYEQARMETDKRDG
jgi:hypothetical protein